MIQQLRARDLEVRSHEQAHVAAAGSLAQGGPSFQFTRGPDGRLYATGGEVGIDVSPVANDPHATIEKAQQIRPCGVGTVESITSGSRGSGAGNGNDY